MFATRKIKMVLRLSLSIILFCLDAVILLAKNLTPYALKRKKSVRGEIVLITGGGSGFGRQLALKFSRLGATVVVWDVDDEGARETSRLVEAEGGTIRSYSLDVSDRQLVYKTARLVAEEVGPVSILVNNAGIAHSSYFLETSDALLEKVVAVNTAAHFWTMKAFLPNMMENNHGHVVCVSSMAGIVAGHKCAAYVASKHAVMGLMDSISMELIDLGKTGVKTTVVCPYVSRTSIFEGSYDGLVPLTEPERVAELIIRGVLTDKEVVYIPWYAGIMGVLKQIMSTEAAFRLGRSLTGEAFITTVKTRTIFKEQKSY